MAQIENVEIASLLFDEQASAPTTPATGFWRHYFKSDGMYVVDDAGTETGPLGAGGGSATAELLAVKKYAPAQTTLSTTSTSMVDVDATNLAVTFTAPASGNVIVRLSAFGDMNSAAGEGVWGLRESTTDLSAARIMRASDNQAHFSVPFYLTGVTSGAHTYKWAYGVSSGTTRIIVGPGVAIASFPAALMEVWSAP